MEFNPPAGEWWLNLRQSNTESFIRLNIETTSKKSLDQKIKELRKLINRGRARPRAKERASG